MRVLLITLLLLVAALQWRLWRGEGGLAEIQTLEQEIARQQVENDTLLRRNNVLIAEVEELKTGTEAIEERARSELGMVKEDETFYLIVP